MVENIGVMSTAVAYPVAILLLLTARMSLCVPAHFMDVEQHFRNIDLDAEQTEARYDQEMLSDIINDNDRGELQKAESCLVDDYKYDHGQKIQRLDPCEICLCIDGEIFCWWKQCDSLAITAAESDSQIGASQQESNNDDQLSSDLISEASTATSTANAVGIPTTKAQGFLDSTSMDGNDGSNGATRLTLSDSLTDSGTTIVSSTLPISTPSSRTQNTEHASSEVVTHHGSVHTPDTIEGIPKNILSFPQTPPIMMYRPVSTGPMTSTPPREGKFVDGIRKTKHGSTVDDRNKPSYKLLYDFKKSIKKPVLNGDRKPTVAIASDALPKVLPVDSTRKKGVKKSYGQSLEETVKTTNNGQNSKSSEAKELKSGLEEQQQFGGYGYGMIHEPESDRRSTKVQQRNRDRDVPQHYIITSSGHVEMFDDSGAMGGSEVGTESQDTHISDADGFEKQQYRDVLSFDGRVSSRVVQDQPSNGLNDEDSEDPDSDEEDTEEETGELRSEDSGAIAPAIMLTTNVTQGKYSLGERQPSTQMPPSPASVIDILNSTTLETDYVDGTNHSELIYPEVPSISSSGVSSSIISSSTAKSPTKQDQSEQHCVVMGVTYPVGAVLKQETGNCLQCVCVAGPENDPAPRVTCTPLNCPPLILPDILDGAGF